MSASLRNSSEYVAKISGSRKLTKEDIASADRMEREIIRKQHAVIDHSYDKCHQPTVKPAAKPTSKKRRAQNTAPTAERRSLGTQKKR